uniref:Signal transducing adapter molecule 1 n=1 Tax=Syphacia muris TaxID=451379 RepID=A0A0N5B1E4_9BILA
MPLFGETQSPYDEIITKVTAETCGTENWRLIFDIVDKVVADPKSSKMCLLSLKKRLNHRDPHVVLLALTVLDTLWSNCGQPFRQEVSSREFSQELGYKATQSNRAVGEKTRSIIKKWAEEDCEKDPSLGLIASLYKGLVNDGYSFETEFSEKKIPMSTDPNVVQSTEEAEAIARAIELSLGETKKETTMQLPNTSSQLQFNNYRYYFFFLCRFVERNVRALYDFEAAEDGELTFSTGDILTVLEECDANWWKGRCKGMVGLFPSSFVTTDLSETRKDDNEISANEIQDQKLPQQPVLIPHIDEKLLIQCESLIQECHPSKADPPELLEMERLCLAQEPLIEARVAEIDKQSNALDSTEASIANALSLYDSVIQEQIQFQVSLLFNWLHCYI